MEQSYNRTDCISEETGFYKQTHTTEISDILTVAIDRVNEMMKGCTIGETTLGINAPHVARLQIPHILGTAILTEINGVAGFGT